MATRPLYSFNHFSRMHYGDFGIRCLDKDNVKGLTSSPSGETYCKIQVLKDAEITFTNGHTEGQQTFTAIEIKEGQTIYGEFSSVTMVNGIALCYLRHNN